MPKFCSYYLNPGQMEVVLSQLLARYSRILEVVGDIVKVQVPASESGGFLTWDDPVDNRARVSASAAPALG